MAINEVSFTVSVNGEVTGEKFYGTFKCKTRLSHRDMLTIDKIRRELLGTNAEEASPDARAFAAAIAQLSVRLTSAPAWWTDNGNGMDLSDEEVVAAVLSEAIKAETDARASVIKKAQDAEKDLEKASPTSP